MECTSSVKCVESFLVNHQEMPLLLITPVLRFPGIASSFNDMRQTDLLARVSNCERKPACMVDIPPLGISRSPLHLDGLNARWRTAICESLLARELSALVQSICPLSRRRCGTD